MRLTNIQTVRDRTGKPRRYLRVKGQKLVPLPDLPLDHQDFLATKDGRTRSAKAIGGDVAKAARLAGVRKSAHGLRKARATALADHGATTHQIAAWTGHESLSEVEDYTRTAARRAAVMGTNEDGTVKDTAAKGVKRG